MSWHHRCNWGRPSSSYDSLVNRYKNMQIHRWHVDHAKSEVFGRKKSPKKLAPIRSPGRGETARKIRIMEENSRLLERLNHLKRREKKAAQGLSKGDAFYVSKGKVKRITLNKSVREARERSVRRLNRENALISKRLKTCQGSINRKQFRNHYREHKRLAKLRSRYTNPKRKIKEQIRQKDLLPSCFKTRKEYDKTNPMIRSRLKTSSTFRRAIWRFEHYVNISRQRARKNALRKWKHFKKLSRAASKRAASGRKRLRCRAATIIQTHYRSHRAISVYRIVFRRHVAAIRIQSLVRKRAAKKKVRHIREVRRQNMLCKLHFESVCIDSQLITHSLSHSLT